MKQYVIYSDALIQAYTPTFKVSPKETITRGWKDSVEFVPFNLGEVGNDMRQIGYIEFAEDLSEDAQTAFWNGMGMFCMRVTDEVKVNELLTEWYNGDVSVEDFVVTDNRPEGEF